VYEGLSQKPLIFRYPYYTTEKPRIFNRKNPYKKTLELDAPQTPQLTDKWKTTTPRHTNWPFGKIKI